jgi:L-threonylcarbamoyladenylate synthase
MNREIKLCTEVLHRGGTILYPTDTVWGIGCDATNAGAVDEVYRIKRRKDSKAMLVLVDSIEMISDYVEEIPGAALEILEINDSPLTIIYPGARGLAGNLPGEDGSIGIRITSEPFSRELIKAFGKPVVSSSANLAGHPAPANFAEIPEDIRTAVDHVAGWRQDERKKNKPSGILKVHLNGEIQIIRR